MSTAAMILLERRAEAAEAEIKLRLARMEYATDQHAKIMVENADLKARVAELEAAVKFYADKMSWVSDSPIATPARRDQGQIARAALQRERSNG